MSGKERKLNKALEEYFEARRDRLISPEESFEAGFDAAWNLKQEAIERLELERDYLLSRVNAEVALKQEIIRALEDLRIDVRAPIESQ